MPRVKKHLWYFEVVVSTPVTITVTGETEQEAMDRLHRGAWHGVEPKPRDWSKAEITHTGTITKGPGIN